MTAADESGSLVFDNAEVAVAGDGGGCRPIATVAAGQQALAAYRTANS